MASTAYLTPGPAAQNIAGIPKPTSAPIDPQGNFSTSWWRFFNSFTATPFSEVGVTLGASPTTYTAQVGGTLLVYGGTVSEIDLVRNATYNTGLTAGLIPMSPGDGVTITYSSAPTVTWFPR